ncbi:MAG TPA: Hint domain-containing protein [Acetobacteraceae bacterium]|nr:Hint domain-containing protein [Acetobacteraceae bacterium]
MASDAAAAQGLNYQVDYSDPGNYAGTLKSSIISDMDAALQGYAQHIHGAGTLVVQLNIVASNSSNAGELADGGPTALVQEGTLDGRALELPSSIYELDTGHHVLGTSADIVVNVPSAALGEIYFDPNPAAGDSIASVAPQEYDAITIFRHELTHGLGFISLRDSSTGTLSGAETEFDHYSSITSTADYFIGPAAEAVYGGPVPLTTIRNGEQYSHLGNNPNGPLAQDLMAGTGIANGVTHQVSALDLAVLRDIGVPEIASTPCFAAGTRILTAAGEVAVERLRAGDEVILADGSSAPVIWIGTRFIDIGRHPLPGGVAPILISAGALAEGRPGRDLHVSPDHAMFLDGILVPAKALLNGTTIRQIMPPDVRYFHVELAAHGVIHAEGALAETYLDTGNRAMFANGGMISVLHPDFGGGAEALRRRGSCAPLLDSGAEVEAIRAHLLERAAIPVTADPGLSASANGITLPVLITGPGMAEIILPGSAADIAILSRSFIPGEITPDPRDRRRLGISLSVLSAGEEREWRDIPLDHPALGQGWHAAEPGHRWTDGKAIIPAALLAGAKRLRLRFAAAETYSLAA